MESNDQINFTNFMFFLETTKMKKSNQYKHIRFVTWQWQDDQEKKENIYKDFHQNGDLYELFHPDIRNEKKQQFISTSYETIIRRISSPHWSIFEKQNAFGISERNQNQICSAPSIKTNKKRKVNK